MSNLSWLDHCDHGDVFQTCLTCSPWLQILSRRSQRLAIKVFSSTPVMLTSPWPNSTASRPIFSTSIRFVYRQNKNRKITNSCQYWEFKLIFQEFVVKPQTNIHLNVAIKPDILKTKQIKIQAKTKPNKHFKGLQFQKNKSLLTRTYQTYNMI